MTVGRLLGTPNQFFVSDGIRGQLDRELNVRLEKRSRERALFKVFFAAPMLLDNVAEAMPVRSLKRQLQGNAVRVIRRVLQEGRSALQGLATPEFSPSSIEQELFGFLKQFSTGVVHCEVSVTGHRKELKPAVQEQINLIAREALVNALLHSEATCIEAEVEYLPRRLRVVVRDNGRGVRAWKQGDAHQGLLGMRDRAKSLGAKLTIWSSPDAGTEVEILVSGQAFASVSASDV
jgi:signal transduction histidine kinase